MNCLDSKILLHGALSHLLSIQNFLSALGFLFIPPKQGRYFGNQEQQIPTARQLYISQEKVSSWYHTLQMTCSVITSQKILQSLDTQGLEQAL